MASTVSDAAPTVEDSVTRGSLCTNLVYCSDASLCGKVMHRNYGEA